MYNRILIATDGSDLAGRAVEHGLQLAKSLGGSVVFVTVTEIWSPLEMAGEAGQGRLDAVKAFEDQENRSAGAVLQAAAEQATTLGVSCETRHVGDCKPAEGILDTAELEECDLIVMASHGRRGLGRVFLGSQTAEVLAHSKRPVLVLR